MGEPTCDCWSYNLCAGHRPEVCITWPFDDSRPRGVMVDACIAHVVKHLWDAGKVTLSSCCGHGKNPPGLVLDNAERDYAAVRALIAEVDDRSFDLWQWQLVALPEEARP